MIRAFPKLSRTLAAFAALAMIAVACGDGDDTAGDESPAPDATEDEAGPTGSVSMHLAEPEALVTLNSNESEGIEVLRNLYSMLIGYDVRTTEPYNLVAESIETEDNQNYTITLKDGWTFHDGSEVTAQSFVDAWNYGAYGPNAMQNSGFFEPIEGSADLQCGTVQEPDPETGEMTDVPDCEGQPPAADTLSGLEVVDDLTFTVALSQPQAFFPQRLGYPAYAPLPTAFFDDPDGFNENPIGNGPFMMAEPWAHNEYIRVEVYPEYAGENKPNIAELEFRIYGDVNTALNDLLAGNLDIVGDVPPDRATEIEQQAENFGKSPQSAFLYLGFPLYDPQYGGEENADLRAALSMAVDREAIAETIFNGTRQAAYSMLPPVIPGHQEQVCENWSHNPEEAVARFEAAGGFEGPMQVWFNSGAGHDAWVEAVTNQWREVLGIQEFEFQQLPFAEYLQLLDNQEVNGPFRLGWSMDYPHPQNFLQLLLDSEFVPPNGSNNTRYGSEEFDAALEEALAETDLEQAIPLYQRAQEIACQDTPLIPIAFYENLYAWTNSVSDVYADAFGDINTTEITVSDAAE